MRPLPRRGPRDPGFTGISPYEAPVSPELVLDTNRQTVDESVGAILRFLEEKGYLAL